MKKKINIGDRVKVKGDATVYTITGLLPKGEPLGGRWFSRDKWILNSSILCSISNISKVRTRTVVEKEEK